MIRSRMIRMAATRRSSSGTWTPADPTTNGGITPSSWWDASTLALNDGDLVTSFPDLSGIAHLSQTAVIVKPSYKAAGFNGNPCIYGNGTQQMSNFTAGLTSVGGCHIFTVCRTYSLTTYRGVFSAAQDFLHPNDGYDGNSATGINAPNTSASYNQGFGAEICGLGTVYEDRSAYRLDTPCILDSEFMTGASGYVKYRYCGTTRSTIATTAAGNALDWVSLPGRCSFGGNSPAQVDIAEVIWYPSPLSISDAAQVRSYLSAKYGISVV